jgi:chemotaxis protein MotB
MRNILGKGVIIISIGLFLAGCTFIFQTGRRSDAQKIEELSQQLDELSRTKGLLEGKLSQEIKDQQVKLQMMEKGLVITVVGDLLFDSGKARIRPEAYPLLKKIAVILREDVPAFDVGIEGYTDNQPIKFSGWKTNWELSSARALSVLHYLINEEGIAQSRLSARGYGEHHPVASNDTREGQQLNRRVEIVILPQATRVKDRVPPQASAQEPPQKIK